MAREITEEDWPARLADEDVIARVGGQAFLRGRRYADEGRVRALSVSAGGDILMAQVAGSGGRLYQTMLHAREHGERIAWGGSCSCPVGADCKHVAAVVLAAREAATAQDESADSDWELALGRLLRVTETSLRAMALEVAAVPRPGWPEGSGLSLLPLIEGKRGWNRQGAAWNQVLSGSLRGEVDEDVLLAVQEIGRMAPNGFYYADDRVALDDVPPRVWEVLRRGVAAGLTLTTAQSNGAPVRIEPGLLAGVSLRRVEDGDLLISPGLDLSGVAGLDERSEVLSRSVVPVGRPPHGFYAPGADGALVLMPIDPPPGEVLSRVLSSSTQRILVPAADVPRFEAEQLSRLLRAVPVTEIDAGLRVPEPLRLGALLRVTVDGSTHESSTSWWMRYVSESGEVRLEAEVGSLSGEEVAAQGGSGARDLVAERRLARELITALIPLAARHGIVWNRRRMSGIATARFFAGTLPALEALGLFDVEVVGDAPDYHESDEAPLITTEVEDDDERPDWFSLRVRVSVGDEQVPIERLIAAVASGSTEVLLDSGAWINVDRPEIHRLASLMEEGRYLADPRSKGSGTMSVTPFQAGYYEQLVELGVVGEASRRWKDGVGRLLAMTAPGAGAGDSVGASGAGERAVGPGAAGGQGSEGAAEAEGGAAPSGPETEGDALDVPVPAGLRAELRPYQLDGYRWLDLLRSTGLGGVLADDMGLGKTVQVLAAVQRLVEQRGRDGVGGPVLVVAPTSVVGAWVEQAARFCPSLRVLPVTRTAGKRGEALADVAAQADVLVTSYTMVRLEEEDFAAVEWSWAVLDEAQFVKNRTSATYKAVRRLRTPSTVAITGTPLENTLMDLWSLLSVSAPGLLPGPEAFTKTYRRPIERGSDAALAQLRARIHPFMLRRTKEQVAAELPEKTEQVISVELGAAHRRAYEARLIRERQKVMGLLEDDTSQARFSALKSLTTLRLMALDPGLVEDGDEDGAAGAGGAAADGARAAGAGGASASAGGASASAGGAGAGRRRRPSAKVEVLLESLEPVVAEGHKALVFSQFTRYLRGVREDLEAAGMRTAYLDGTTADRQSVIDSFRAGEADVFLISLKAGGFGLTLTEADYVFLLDPWWNPQAEEQAVDRAHRIGQDKPVLVYRLVSEGTIEEKVMALKDRKAELFDRVVEESSEELSGEAAARAGAEAGGAVGSGASRAGGAGAGRAGGAGGGVGGAASSAAATSRARLTAQEIRELFEE